MRKGRNATKIIVVMIIGLFLGTCAPSMGRTSVSAGGSFDAHDLAATNITCNNPVYKTEPASVIGKIKNVGTSDETGAPVNLFFNYTGQSSDGYEYYDPLPQGWSRITTCSASPWFFYYTSSSLMTSYPKVQETNANNLAQDEWLITPTIDCSAMTTVRMILGTKYVYLYTGTDSYVQILGSTDNGVTWPNVIYSYSTAGTDSTPMNTTLSWAVGCSTVKVAFRFVSSADSNLNDYFYFDNLFIGQPWGWGDNPPAGWTIQNYGSETPNVWNANDWHRYSYGSGYALSNMVARSYYTTPGETSDEWLITPTIDCSGKTSVWLRYSFYYSLSSSNFFVNGSTDGGVTWDKPVYKYAASVTTSYLDQLFDISSWAAGQSNVKLRFRFKTTTTISTSYVYLDNVRVYSGQTFLLNQKFDGSGLSSSFDLFQNDLTDAWGSFNWQQTPVNTTTYPITTTTAYNQFFSVTSATNPSVTPHGGSRMVMYYGWMAASGAKARFFSGPLGISGLKTLKFWMYHDTTYTGSGSIQVQVSTNGVTWTNLGSAILRNNGAANGWYQHTFDITAYYTNPNLQIGFLATSDYNGNIFLDDFSVLYDDTTHSSVYSTTIDIPAGTTQNVPYTWTPTLEGSCTVTLEAVPVPGETIITNNTFTRAINVLSVPNIWISPTSLEYTIVLGNSASQTLTVGNDGTAVLTGTIVKNQAWLTLSSTTLNLAAGSSTPITVGVDGTQLPSIGDYTATITITSNDPDESPLTIPVTVHVTLPPHDVAVTNIAVNNPAHLLEINPITATIANNGGSDETGIPVTIQVTSLLNESFETCIPGYYIFPPGWTNTSINPTGRWFMYVSGTYPTATTYPKITEPNTNPQDEVLISPVFNCAALSQVTMTFTKYLYLYTGTNTSVQILGSTDGGATWPTIIYNWATAQTNSTSVTKDITSWAAGCANVRIAFRFLSPGGATHGDYFYFDDFWIGQVATTYGYDFESTWGPYGDVPPAGWTITTNETTPVTWDTNNWYKYAYGAPQGNVARVYYSPVRYQNESLISPTIDCSALSSVTLRFWHYFYYYSALSYGWVDGSIDGGATWPYNIATYHASDGPAIKMYDISSWAHNQPNVKIRFHYQDHDGEYWNVDDFWVGSSTQVYTTPFNSYYPDYWGPLGWQQVQVSGTASGNKFTAMTSGTSPTCTPHQGTKMVQYNSYAATAGNTARFYTTALTLPSPRNLKFWMFHDSTTYQTNNDSLTIQASTDGTTWTTVGGPFYRSCTLQGLPLVDAWAQHTVDLSSYSGSPIYLAVFARSAYGYNMYFDDFSIEYGPQDSTTTYTTTVDLTSGATCPVTFDWTPTLTGFVRITATAGPITGETYTVDNTKTKLIGIISVPDILVTPDSFFDIIIERFTTFNETLTIQNTGTATLTGTIDTCPAWLYLSQTSVTLPPETQTNIYLTNDPLTPEGDYSATLTITSNDPDENPVLVPITMTVIPNTNNYLNTIVIGSGTVLRDPDQTTYAYGTNVTLTAIPDEGWLFDHWEGDATGTDNPTTITMNGTKEVTAIFTITSGYTLTTNTEGQGSIQIDPEQQSYTWGDQVTLHAVPDIGWQFDHWTGDLTGTTNPTTITMLGDKDVTAIFTQINYPLTVTSSPASGGTVTLTPATPGNLYHYGDQVQLQAYPNTGFYFNSWSGSATGSTNPTIITITGSTAVTAHFALTTGWTLTVNTNGQGSVQITPNQPSYTWGDTVSLHAIATTGWVFDHWEGDLTGSTNPTSIVMYGDKTVTAVFTITSGYTLTVSTNGQGTVTKDPDQPSYTYGDIVTLTAIPDLGWEFDHWGGSLSGTTNPTTITMTSNKNVIAYFTQTGGYTLTINIEGLGVVTKNPNQPTYLYGTNVTLTATPHVGWVFNHWGGDVTGTTSPAVICMTGNMTVTANFTITGGYTLTIYIQGQGTVQTNPNQQTYTYGQNVTLTAIPATGWSFKQWVGPVGSQQNPSYILMTSNKSLTAVFQITTGYTLTLNVIGLGNVTKSPNKTGYDYGEIVTLTAYPDEGWEFNHWEGNLSGNANPATIAMEGNKTVTAVFTLTTGWVLTINIDGQGNVTKNPDKESYTWGDVVEVTAIPSPGWFFFQWTGDLDGAENPANITMFGDREITAHFVPNNAPSIPSLSAPSIGIAKDLYNVTAQASDQDGDQVEYLVDFGDGTNSSWTGPYDSGVQATISHIWQNDNQYPVKVKARDVYGHESGWSSTTHVIMTATTRLFGFLVQKVESGNVLHLTAKFVVWRRPGEFKIIRAGQEILAMTGSGLSRNRFVMGLFYATIPHGFVITTNPDTNPTMPSTPTVNPGSSLTPRTHD